MAATHELPRASSRPCALAVGRGWEVDDSECLRMLTTKGLVRHLQRLAYQQQPTEVVDGRERVWMPIAEGLTLPL